MYENYNLSRTISARGSRTKMISCDRNHLETFFYIPKSIHTIISGKAALVLLRFFFLLWVENDSDTLENRLMHIQICTSLSEKRVSVWREHPVFLQGKGADDCSLDSLKKCLCILCQSKGRLSPKRIEAIAKIPQPLVEFWQSRKTSTTRVCLRETMGV